MQHDTMEAELNIDYSTMNAQIAIPVAVKYDTKLGISKRAKDTVILISTIYSVISLIIYLCAGNNIKAKIIIITCGAILVGIILYDPLYHLVYAIKVIDIHTSDTIANPAMTNNIISSATNEQKNINRNIWTNFINPSWDTNAINIFNKIVMTFYEINRKIFYQLESIDKIVTDNSIAINSNKREIIKLQTDVAGLKTDVAGLKTDVAGLKTDVAGLKTDVAGLKTDVAGLKTDVAGLKETMDTRFDNLDQKFANLQQLILNQRTYVSL